VAKTISIRLKGVSGALSESYGNNSSTGNLGSKGGAGLFYEDTFRFHAATFYGWTYPYDDNGNMVTCGQNGGTIYALHHDAENRLEKVAGRLGSYSGGIPAAGYAAELLSRWAVQLRCLKLWRLPEGVTRSAACRRGSALSTAESPSACAWNLSSKGYRRSIFSSPPTVWSSARLVGRISPTG
jgi:hypothetical protein